MTLRAVARQRVSPGRWWWVGGIIKHRGHPFIVECGHKHRNRQEAFECGEALLHAEPGSIVAEELAKHRSAL